MIVSVTKNEVKITELSQVNQGDYKVNLCTFVLPECFSGLSVTAVFNGIPVPIAENRCYIPSLEIGNCILGVYAYKEENGKTMLMYSPKPTVFYVDRGSFTTDVNTEALPKVFDYETYCNMLKDFWEQIVKENALSSNDKKINLSFNKFPFEVIDLPLTEANYAYACTEGTYKKKDNAEEGFSPITKCPKYLGFRIDGDETRLYLYIGTMVDGKFELDESYIIDTTESGTINHLRQSHNRFIETDGEKYFYYKINAGSKDKITLIGCDEFPEGESDVIATTTTVVKNNGDLRATTSKYYSIVLPSGCFYAVLNKKGMPTFLKPDTEDEETTTVPIFNVSYQTGVTEDEVPVIEVSKGASFGVIPENVGAALLRLPCTYELSDLCIYTDKIVKSNSESGRRRKANEIGEKIIKDFSFLSQKEIFWNDSVRAMESGRRFYGVPYSSRWVNSHYLGFEVSVETMLNALNDPCSVAYDGGFTEAVYKGNTVIGKKRGISVSGHTEISGKGSTDINEVEEPNKNGGTGYGLVCSAFTNLICGNPYPQSNRGYTFDSNYDIENTVDMNSGEVLVNKGLSHCVFVDEIYDKGYSLLEAVDPCVAKTTHTCPPEIPSYASSRVRTNTLDEYVYSVTNKDTSGYDKLKPLLNFENITIANGKVRPWRGNKAVYGSWDITPKASGRDFGGSGIGVTLHDGITSFVLKTPSGKPEIIDNVKYPQCFKNESYADISRFVTEDGTYEISDGNVSEFFRFYNHHTVQLAFDVDGKAVFKNLDADGKIIGDAEDVEYVYVGVKGYGGAFGNDDSVGDMVIARGNYYPDLALDTSRILDVRAAIVSDPEANSWGKYSCATSPDVVSEYKGSDFATKDYVDEAIKHIDIVPSVAGGIDYDLTVKSINHRGYNTIAPENTIPAYILSKEKGFKYVECDVCFTSDNVPVLLHDATIDRTSNGSGNVASLTYAELLAYDFGRWKGTTYAGTKIPTFKEFIMTCKGLGLHPYIEIKNDRTYTQEQVAELVNIVETCGMKGKVSYISFNAIYLEYVKALDSSASLGYVTNNITETIVTTANELKTEENEVFLDVRASAITEEKVSLCIENNLPLEVWTINGEDDIKNMNSYISGVTSDNLIAGKVLYEKYMTYTVPETPATAISLSQSSLTFDTVDTQTLVATLEPTYATDKVVWSSSDENVATVSEGVVTPIAKGSCIITATAGNVSATCEVTVNTITYRVWDENNTITIPSSEFMVGYSLKSNGYPYHAENAQRTAYVNFDIPFEYGYKYTFNLITSENVQIGIPYYNEAAKQQIANRESFTANMVDEGWKPKTVEITPPQTINDSPVAGVRITINKALTVDEFEGLTITRVKTE